MTSVAKTTTYIYINVKTYLGGLLPLVIEQSIRPIAIRSYFYVISQKCLNLQWNMKDKLTTFVIYLII